MVDRRALREANGRDPDTRRGKYGAPTLNRLTQTGNRPSPYSKNRSRAQLVAEVTGIKQVRRGYLEHTPN